MKKLLALAALLSAPSASAQDTHQVKLVFALIRDTEMIDYSGNLSGSVAIGAPTPWRCVRHPVVSTAAMVSGTIECYLATAPAVTVTVSVTCVVGADPDERHNNVTLEGADGPRSAVTLSANCRTSTAPWAGF